jgi:carboxypeptidase Taq
MSATRDAVNYEAIRRALQSVSALEHARGVLAWDADVAMPASGSIARARALGELARIRHRSVGGARYRQRLADAESELRTAGYDDNSFERTLVQRAVADEERDRRVSPALTGAIAEAIEQGRAAWGRARVADDWAVFAPALRRMLELQRRQATQLNGADPYGGLLGLYEPGLTTGDLLSFMAAVEAPLQRSIDGVRAETPLIGNSIMIRASQQLALARDLAHELGLDLGRLRIDEGQHPNTMRLAADDIRIAVRVDPARPYRCLREAAHECGHALYFQCLPRQFETTPLWGPASAGVNEAAARFWELIIVGSRPFAELFLPTVQRHLRDRAPTTVEELHLGLQGTSGTLDRLESDVSTYLLHIILRTRIEIELIDGRLRAENVPTRWNDLCRAFFGFAVSSPRQGPLQDIHWSIGLFGYFPTYLIGTLAAYQLWDACKRQLALHEEKDLLRLPEIQDWLASQVWRHGRSRDGLDLIASATHCPLAPEAFLSHVATRSMHAPLALS